MKKPFIVPVLLCCLFVCLGILPIFAQNKVGLLITDANIGQDFALFGSKTFKSKHTFTLALRYHANNVYQSKVMDGNVYYHKAYAHNRAEKIGIGIDYAYTLPLKGKASLAIFTGLRYNHISHKSEYYYPYSNPSNYTNWIPAMPILEHTVGLVCVANIATHIDMQFRAGGGTTLYFNHVTPRNPLPEWEFSYQLAWGISYELPDFKKKQ